MEHLRKSIARLTTLNIDVFFVYFFLVFIIINKTKTSFSKENAFIFAANILLLISSYTINKFSDKEEDSHNEASVHTNKIFFLYAPLFFTLLTVISSYYIAGMQATLIYLLITLLSLTYSFPKKNRLKKIFIIKNIIPSLSWYLSLTLLVASLLHTNLPTVCIPLVPFFILFFLIEIYWDIPDREGDALAHVKTLPVEIGDRRTRGLLIISFSLLSFVSLKTFLPFTLPLVVFLFISNSSTRKVAYRVTLLSVVFILFLLSFF